MAYTLAKEGGKIVGFTGDWTGKVYSFEDPLFAPYLTCRVCGKPLPEALVASSVGGFSRGVCSPECSFREHVCCEKAVGIPCVCAWSWVCPEHGEHHVGTHD